MNTRELETAKPQPAYSVSLGKKEEQDASLLQPVAQTQKLLQLQRNYGNRYVQRMVDLARKGDEDTEVAPEVEDAIQRARGGGQALDSGVREQMEQAFSADFRDVRIHADHEADKLNQVVNARAFTVNQDIFFSSGEYNTNSQQGQELLIHELAHVAQRAGITQFKLNISKPDDENEQEAEHIARTLVSGVQNINFVTRNKISRNMKLEEKARSEPNAKSSLNIAEFSAKDRAADHLFTILIAAFADLKTNASEWELAAENFGLCYKKAYEGHVDAINAQNRNDQIKADLAFAVLSIVTQGAIAGLSTLAVRKEWTTAPEWAVNSLEDTMQNIVGESLGTAKNLSPSRPVSSDPLEYYIQIKKQLHEHITWSLVFVNNWVQCAKKIKLRPDRYPSIETFNTEEFDNKIEIWKKTVRLFQPPPMIPEVALTRELEIGMWAKWAAGTLYRPASTREAIGEGGAYYSSYIPESFKSPGGKIEEHLKLLKIPNLDVESWGWWTSEAEAKQLVTWGRNWTPDVRYNL